MKTEKNVVMRYASGMLGGQVVAREWKGRPYIANRPTYRDDREFSEAQISQQQKFLDGAAYAKGVISMEEIPEVYVEKAESQELSTYNVAMRDFLKPPNVREIIVDGYTGKPGEVIVIRATDDTEVASVSVSIHNGEVVEQGEAVRDPYNATLWLYTTTRENELPGTKVEAYAVDRPGNVVGAMVEL
jgi:signal peptidase I